jgi:hypothetical protein
MALRLPPGRLVLRGIGLTIVCAAAVVASFSSLAGLAEFTGWNPWASWLLPLSLDALGGTACLVWLDRTAPKQARDWAQWMTWVAAGLSIIGNGAGHLTSTGHLQQGLVLVVLVAAVPPAALATTVHLIVLVSPPAKTRPVRDAAPVPAKAAEAKPAPEGKPKPSPKPIAPKSGTGPATSGLESGPVVDEVLLQHARRADRDHRANNDGRPISRDGLKDELKIGTGKATDLLAVLKKEREVA